MGIKQQIDQDIKTAMLAGDKTLVTTLRGLKSAILYVEVASGSREEGLPEDQIVGLLSKEAKKRQESADLFAQGGNQQKAAAELTEKDIIQGYLPAQISDKELMAVVDEVIASLGATDVRSMGQVIAAVKQKAGHGADGGRIAQFVKTKLG